MTATEYPIFGTRMWYARWPGDDQWYAFRMDKPGAANVVKCGHGHKTLEAAEKCLAKMRKAATK